MKKTTILTYGATLLMLANVGMTTTVSAAEVQSETQTTASVKESEHNPKYFPGSRIGYEGITGIPYVNDAISVNGFKQEKTKDGYKLTVDGTISGTVITDKVHVELRNKDHAYLTSRDYTYDKQAIGSFVTKEEVSEVYMSVVNLPNCSITDLFELTDDEKPAHHDAPVINGADNTTIDMGSTFDPKAGVTATDWQGKDLTSQIKISGKVDTGKAGTYTLTYSVTDAEGQKTTVKRVITVKDHAAPVINGATDKTIKVGEEFDPKAGVTATDWQGNDLTGKIVISGEVDTSKVGSYKVTYSVTDATGKKAEKSITVHVVSNEKPVITAEDKTINVGDKFTPLDGVTASDSEDGDLTSKVKVKANDVNTAKAGTYHVTYTVTDSDGNTTEKTITVTVKDTSNLVAPVIEDYYTTDTYTKGTIKGDAVKVAIFINGEQKRTATVTNGTWKIYTGDLDLKKVGNKFEVAGIDANGKIGPKATGIVKQKNNLQAPVINSYYTTDRMAAGTIKGDATKVAIFVNGEQKRIAAVTDGKWEIYTGDLDLKKAGNKFEIAGVAADGQIGPKTSATVLEKKGSVETNDFKIGQDSTVTGTATNVDKVELKVDGKIIRSAKVVDGKFELYAKDVIKSTTQTVEVLAYDVNFAQVASKNVSLSEVAIDLTADNYQLNSENVTGHAGSNVTKVELWVNGKAVRKAQVADGAISTYAKDVVKSKKDTVELVAYTNFGATKKVTVKVGE